MVNEQNKEKTRAPEVDFSTAREMQPYLKEPEAMYVGAPGKHGYLRLGFELDSTGKSILRDLERRHPLIVQCRLSTKRCQKCHASTSCLPEGQMWMATDMNKT